MVIEMQMFWRTKAGIHMPLSRMKTSHIKNCVKMLEYNSKHSFDDFEKMLNYWWANACESDNLPDAPPMNTIRPAGFTKVWIDAFRGEMMSRRTDYELEYGY